MSAHESHALDSIALQLLAALEHYDTQTAATLAAWPDLAAYGRMSEQVEQIRMYCSSLPQLRVQWVELLIAHAELVHCLWRAQFGEQDLAQRQVGAVRDHHAECIAALRARALRCISRR
jgi:hypothetical protein